MRAPCAPRAAVTSWRRAGSSGRRARSSAPASAKSRKGPRKNGGQRHDAGLGTDHSAADRLRAGGGGHAVRDLLARAGTSGGAISTRPDEVPFGAILDIV